MKVEELYLQDQQSQIGITLERQPFETKVDIFPEVSPFWKSETGNEAGEPTGMAAELASPDMEEQICKVVKHQPLDSEEEFQPIPLKRIDSGPTSHCMQGLGLRGTEETDMSEPSGACRAAHQSLLDEIDKGDSAKKDGKTKTKKDSTLTRMKDRLKNMRGDKDEESKINSKALGKILNRMNPVSKASRESFSKVFQRIGDALQKKPDEEKEKEEKKPAVAQDKKVEDERVETVKKSLAFTNETSDHGLNNN